ncbi:hypothetical protein G6F62_008151 [Rhizopus arrhizus]|nr:hypothetical protein G6F24_011559 [Rhizopus arrhizus]KAG0781929.1 hypothetical protein G6F21_011387 [Rhizopus arrhizus]KAG0786052.1 hypothetical protein G6F22_007749 [Rhizopus arrhizus]KAG0806037.1 hypothetical protein G6F20_011443 [Rhizopus arrhizus]KAG0823857.1 hypothetical protein G6F19_010646 [Rhizopus arrhizus]
MALPAKKILVPNKAIVGLKPQNFHQSKQSWVNVLMKGSVSSSYNSSTQARASSNTTLDSNENRTFETVPDTRPFLKGTTVGSLFLNITAVDNHSLFIKELFDVCDGRKHLWGVEERLKKDLQSIYVEITVSPEMHETIRTTGVDLPSFPSVFIGYPSISPDVEILKISLSGLPREYGRETGGLEQLKQDTTSNLQRYGTVVDCGLAWSVAGTFGGKGYVYLETISKKSQGDNSTNDGRPASTVPHVLNWQYMAAACHLGASEKSDISNEAVVYATWNSMKAYCRYCHSQDHVIVDCEDKKKATICFHCNGFGHIARDCPRKNRSSSGAPNTTHKRARKVPSSPLPASNSVSETVPGEVSAMPSSSSSVPLAKPMVKDFLPTTILSPSEVPTIERPVATESTSAPAHTAEGPSSAIAMTKAVSKYAPGGPQTRAKSTASSGVEPTDLTKSTPGKIKICKHCGLEGHVKTTHRSCLQNPKLIEALAGTASASHHDGMDVDAQTPEETDQSSADPASSQPTTEITATGEDVPMSDFQQEKSHLLLSSQ